MVISATTNVVAKNEASSIKKGSNSGAATSLASLRDAYDKGSISKGEAIQSSLMEENKKTLDLYGLVVDQNGEPVVGAKVRGSIGLNVNMVQSGGELHYTETDSQGRFNFLGIHGVGIGLWPQKEGYFYDLKLPSHRPDNYQPAPNNPIVLTMWKLKGAESMIHDSKFYGITPDARPYTIDLIERKKTEGQNAGGDLVIQIQRPAQISPGQKFDWSFAMSVIDGGLIEVTNKTYLNEAPENGYEQKHEIKSSASDPQWQSQIEETFFLKSRSGQAYGHFHITVIPLYRDTAVFKIDSYINPSGSRNLEFDPAKQIR